jgi:hypothetical protein
MILAQLVASSSQCAFVKTACFDISFADSPIIFRGRRHPIWGGDDRVWDELCGCAAVGIGEGGRTALFVDSGAEEPGLGGSGGEADRFIGVGQGGLKVSFGQVGLATAQ